jgi:DNA-directed RNA polymerase alpha subunit
MLFNKIIIYYINLVKIPKEDKLRTVDKLDLPKEIINKLKFNDFIKVMDITEVNRERLLQFLTNQEVELVIKSLKKYELFIKGELEAIIDNDETVDV